MANEDRFGFLTDPIAVLAEDYVIEPIGDHADAVQRVQELSDQDRGFFYPPQQLTRRLDPTSLEWRLLPGAGRIAHTFPLQWTHTIRRIDDTPLGTDPSHWRSGEVGFLLQVLGFIQGQRCQFAEWRFDGRIPVKSNPITDFSDKERCALVRHMLRAYRSMNQITAVRFANALFFKTRTPSYIQDWERFLMEYTVLDALHKCAVELGLICGKGGHKKRIEELGLAELISWTPKEQAIADLLVNLRNNLVHEALWVDQPIGSAFGPQEATCLVFLNQRLALSIVGTPCGFSRSPWGNFGSYPLDWTGPP